MNALMHRLEQIRRHKWIVLVVAVCCMAVAIIPALSERPVYVGKSTLMVASPGRATDQDAYIAVAYTTLLNDPATTARLKAATKIPANVTFEARTAASSPILTIEATADNPEGAQNAAANMAAAFRDDINAAQQKGRAEQIAVLQRQLIELSTTPVPDNLRLPDGSAPWNPSVVALQDRINTLRLDLTNQLQDLQPRAGVDENAPSLVMSAAKGTLGGLLLGVLAALGFAAVSTRLTTSADLRDKTGVEPLVEIPVGGSVTGDQLRRDRLRTLLNFVTLEDLPKSPVLALTSSRAVEAAHGLAEELATVSAGQGYRTVLVYADNHAPEDAHHGGGFNDALTDSGRVHNFLLEDPTDSGLDSLKVLPFGLAPEDGHSQLTRERVIAILDELRTEADLIIMAAPGVAETIRTELVCGAADLTLLVVSARVSRTVDVTAATDLLARARANLRGALLVEDQVDRSPAALWARIKR